MRKIQLLGWLFLLTALFASCGGSDSSEDISIEAEYLQYINEYTGGVVSKNSSIIVRLANPSPAFNSSEKEKSVEGIFEFSPKIKGESHWLDQYTVEFKPQDQMISGKEYIATFHLSNIQKVLEEKNNDFKFAFKVVKQNISMQIDHPIYKEDGNAEVNGTLLLADRESPEILGKLVSATLDDKEQKIEWGAAMPHSGGCHYPFKVTCKTHATKDLTLNFKFDGNPIGCDKKGSKTETIYSPKEFLLLDHKIVNGNDAHIEIYFNQALPLQDLKSKVRFSDDMGCTVSQEHSVIKVYPARHFMDKRLLIIEQGIMGQNAMTTKKSSGFEIKFENIKPAVEFPNTGTILPSTDGATLPFRAVNLKSVDVTVLKIRQENILQHLQVNNLNDQRELKRVAKPILTKSINLEEVNSDVSQWQTYFLDLTELANQDQGAIYSIILSFKKSDSAYPCDSGDEADDEDDDYDYSGVKKMWKNAANEVDYGYYYYDYDGYDYNYEDYDNPCKKAYYRQSRRRAQTNILLSDLGVIAKRGSNNMVQVIVNDIKTTAPVNDAKVKIYSYQLELLGEATTDNNGFVNIPYEEEVPIFVEVEKEKQKNYLKINDANALSLSAFDVAGAVYEKGLKGYIYGERGVWRPGDTLNISLIIQDQEGTLPDNHPIVMSLITPKGQKYAKNMQKYHSGTSIYAFRIPTEMEVPTGFWNISFKVGGATFSKTLNIETIKPNRIKIKLEADNEVLTNEENKFQLHTEWLHGGVSSNLLADVSVKMTNAKTAFNRFSDYSFESPAAKEFRDTKHLIFKGVTDANGDRVFKNSMPTISNAPGMMNAQITTRVFENSGDFSISTQTFRYSPYKYYIGLKAPEAPNQRGIYYTNKEYTFKVVTVNADGKTPSSDKRAFYRIYKLDWSWWWGSRDEDGLAYYVSNKHTKSFDSGSIPLKNGQGEFTVKIKDDDWGGFLILVEEGDGHIAGCTAMFDWENCVGKSQKDNPIGATMLTFTTDKGTYKVGEKIKVTIPSSAGNRSLVSIENRSKVISSQWVESKGNSTTIELEATPEMVPNAYLNITMLQPHKTTANDLPIRLYGVQNITVQDESTILRPKIEMSDEVRSGKPFEVTISEENKNEMEYTLAIVDEGLLDITGFTTPNAHDQFYRHEALGVNTWDIYNQVIGAYGGRIENLFGIGGDKAILAQESQAEKRFKPVVKFVGPCKLAAGKKTKHKIELPSYYGAVRVMVVAGNNRAYGCAEKSVKVTSPLMVLATLPRVAGPGEEIVLPVNVFNHANKSKKVKVSVSTASPFKVTDKAEKEISIDANSDNMALFHLKVDNTIGKQQISICATDGVDDAKTSIWLESRNPNPRITNCQTIVIEPGNSGTLKGDKTAGDSHFTLEIGALPSLNLERRLGDLIGYPHGCAEQTTSKGYPQLLLPSIYEMTKTEIDECETNVKNAISKLEQMQRSDGSVNYWMGGDYTYDWVNNYVGDFIIAAQNRGYNVKSFLSSWYNYQTKSALAWSRKKANDYDRDDLVQAYRLYTLAAYGKPSKGAMNRLKEDKDLSIQAKWRLAGAYALAGDKKTAESIIDGIATTNANDYEKRDHETFGSRLRDEAMVMETLLLLDKQNEAYKLALSIAKQLNSEKWLSTQETAYALIAMSKLGKGNNGENGGKELSAKYKRANESWNTISQSKRNFMTKWFSAKGSDENNIEIVNEGKTKIFISLSQSFTPSEDLTTAKAEGLKFNVDYFNTNGERLDESNIKQGSDFRVEVTVKNTSAYENYQELSLTQIFPSGWEILNDRIGNSAIKEDFSYQDIRDDRVMTYFNLKRGEEKTITVNLHAAYLGRFFLPAYLCEHMYDNQISAKNQGKWVEVTK